MNLQKQEQLQQSTTTPLFCQLLDTEILDPQFFFFSDDQMQNLILKKDFEKIMN